MKALILTAIASLVLLLPNQTAKHEVQTTRPHVVIAVAIKSMEPIKPIAVATVQPILTQHQQWMQEAGIAQGDWSAVDYIVSHESGWCATKWEGEIGYCPSGYAETYSTENADRGYGLCQSTPAIKMSVIASDWQTDPVTQLEWCAQHAASYGGWQAAEDHWVNQIAVVGHGNW